MRLRAITLPMRDNAYKATTKYLSALPTLLSLLALLKLSVAENVFVMSIHAVDDRHLGT